MAKPADIIRHEAAFGAPLKAATVRADWCLRHYLAKGGLLAALAFDRAAEEQQILASREAASRRHWNITD